MHMHVYVSMCVYIYIYIYVCVCVCLCFCVFVSLDVFKRDEPQATQGGRAVMKEQTHAELTHHKVNQCETSRTMACWTRLIPFATPTFMLGGNGHLKYALRGEKAELLRTCIGALQHRFCAGLTAGRAFRHSLRLSSCLQYGLLQLGCFTWNHLGDSKTG